MAFNIEEGAQIAINTFGGLVTEVPPSNVPETGSPDNQECQFWPGAVGGRDALDAVFASPFSSGSPAQIGTVTYGKSYVDPKGIIRNLYLDSLGNLWVENVSTSPGVATVLAAVPWSAGSYAKSITAFGREYIAISDGLHGTDIPLQYDGTNLDRVTQDGPGAPPTVVSTDLPSADLAGALLRDGNVVFVETATPHGLEVGYLVQISGQDPATIGSVTSIVIDNDANPGIATVTYSGISGMVAGMIINISGIDQTVVGGVITAASRQGGVVTIETSTPHGLSYGAFVTIDLNADGTFNSSFQVQQVINANAFSYFQNDVDGTTSGGVVRLSWPLPTTTPTQFEVLAVLDSSTFQIPINYSNGEWTGGSITQAWNGRFFVSAVPTTTTFSYSQIGPSLATAVSIGATSTPYGQVAPGEHQMQVLFLTRQGYTTRPSPPVKFIANGGQYLTVSDIPIGPDNVQARILAFTGTRGSLFYYIPVPAQVNGQVVSTATQINDNTTTSVVLDFSDNTLFAALGINILGNNLPAQIVIDGALGFGHFGSRLITYGQRNRIQNLLNMSFDGGYFPSDTTFPTGWIAESSPPEPGGALTTDARWGFAWEVDGMGGSIYQGFYLDAYGAPIATPRASYTARAWIKGTGTITLTISGGSPPFTSMVTLTGTDAEGAWVEGDFDQAMPDEIPSDMILSVEGTTPAIVDEISIIYTDNPYLDRILYASYVNNPEAFDGLSGKFGPANDTRKVMTFGLIRGTLFLLTRDPTGRLHGVIDNGTTEPVGWTVNEIATNAGCLSAFGLTVSQADDASGGGGEEWLAWASYSGARIFGGDQPWKISQEIQPDWATINADAAQRIWATNDPKNRVMYFGLPLDDATAPDIIYPVDYKYLDTAYQIGQSEPINRGAGGKMAAGEFCRKWTRWHRAMNGAALMYRSDASELQIVFFNGDGTDPANPPSPPVDAFGNVYTLNSALLEDDDYGPIYWQYTTYFFPSHQLEAILGIGTGRKMLEFFQFEMEGPEGSMVRVSFLCNALTNIWPLNCIRDVHPVSNFDTEHPGANATGQRIAFKFESIPVEP